MDAQTLWRPVTGRNLRARAPRGRGPLLQMPPQPRMDARLSRFTALLDAISEGERALAAAHRAVEANDPARAQRELSRFLTDARPALERGQEAHAKDLPAEYVDLLGQTVARALTARAAAWIESAFGEGAGGAALREAARADAAEVAGLPASWVDGKTQVMLARLQRVLELGAA